MLQVMILIQITKYIIIQRFMLINFFFFFLQEPFMLVLFVWRCPMFSHSFILRLVLDFCTNPSQFGVPTLLLSYGFHSKAMLTILFCFFLSVCSINIRSINIFLSVAGRDWVVSRFALQVLVGISTWPVYIAD